MGMRLTLPQKQIYYTEMFNKDAINVNCGSVLLDRLYDVEMLKKAVNEVFRINEALRTRICTESGAPSQYVSEFEEQNIEVLRFGTKEEVHKYGNEQAQIPFDLYGQLCELKVISSDEFCGVFYKVHHIISDAFTFSLISSQIHKLLEGIPVEAGAYSEYIAAEEKYLLGSRVQKDREFFLEQYNNMGDLIYFSDSLPVRGESERLVCPTDKEFTLKIKEFALSQDVSVYAVFLTLISAYISKRKNYSGNFYIGTPVLNRSSVNQMNTAGMFINNVPFPAKVEEDKSFEFNLKKTKDVFFNVLKHQKFNYICALNELNIDQSYDVSFSFQNSTIYGDSFKSTWYHNKVQSESLQIHIDDRDNEGIFNISYDYQIDKFTEKDIKKMHGHLCNLLLDAIENPTKETSALEWLSAEEKQKILHDFNDNAAEYPKDKCVHEIFEELAEKNPGKIAVVACDSSLTYKELNESANRIAHTLIEKGIGKGDIVGLMLPRKSYLLSAMIGIIKSGAAYLPIDPDLPGERIDYILSDSKAKYCITVDNISLLLCNAVSNTPDIALKGTDICYCIYTSGSTGKPKGVLVNHGNVINFCISNVRNEFQSFVAEHCERILCCGNIIFDISVAEISLALSLNKTLVLADETALLNIRNLAVLMKQNQVDGIFTTPTKLYTYLFNDSFSNVFTNIRCVLVAGEEFKAEVFNKLNTYNNVTIFNGYGPTETTMGATFGKIKKCDITIGKPIANVQIYITDKHMNPVPIGVTGELCIAGDGVGAGYLNRPELTAEKFVDNPFGDGKLYKTGDLAYWRDDGNIVFVGRNDFQVKIRGLRIELGEIESALSEIEGINQSVVIVRKDSEDRQLLCAFYTGEEKSIKEIRSELSAKLPRYMVPHIFTYLEEIPLTSSGKINRKALPEVDFENICTDAEYVSPVTVYEKALADAISNVLGVSNINMLDNFFDIGGDSIRAIYLVSELEEMGYELRVSDVMQSGTLLETAGAIKECSSDTVYDQNEVNGFIPFSPIMKAYIEENGCIRRDFVHNCVFYAECDGEIARKAIDAIISHHDILRGILSNDGVVISPSKERDVYSFEEFYIEDTNEAIKRLSRKSVADDKLINIMFCKTAKRNIIGITVHHFLIDLVSWEIVISDFSTAVNQIKNGEKISIPAKTASFKQWIEKLQDYSATIPEEAKDYWKKVNEKLDGVKTLVSFDESVNDAEFYSYSFDKKLTDKLINKANKTYGTRTNEIILTALGLAAGKIADGSVGIFVENHGRAELDYSLATDRTVGWFTSCYPVVIHNNSSVTEELISVKEILRKIPRNGIDYLLLSNGLHKNADILFNFYHSDNSKREILSFNSGDSAFCNKINVDCSIVDDVLTISISIPCCKHRKHIVKELGEELRKCIVQLVDICTNTGKVVKTCSDFSDYVLTKAELEELKNLYEMNGNVIKDIYPLTPSQEGIYAQYFRDTSSKTYRLQSLCRISNNADINRIKTSAELLSVRHEVLKTAFTALKSTGAIKQVILENRNAEIRTIKKNINFSESIIKEIVAEENAKVFDLQNDSLFRVVVIDFDDARFMLVQTHHIIIDGWCLPVIINDLQYYYGKLSDGISKEELIDEIKKEVRSQTSYARYTKWVGNCDKKGATEYWKSLLADSAVPHIFGKEKNDDIPNEDIVTFISPINEKVMESVERISRENKVSHNTVFESAFVIALQKYSGGNDVVFDKVISGRNIPLKNIEKTVGLFINTIPVRIKTDENTIVADLTKEIQNQTVSADKYGILPLAQVYRECNIDSKSVDALFVFENYYTGDISDMENGSLSPTIVSFEEQTGFNLTLAVIKKDSRYILRTSYAKEMYSEREMSEFIRGYISILESASDAERKIKDITVADTELLDGFNKTTHSYGVSSNATLYSLFEKSARENTDKICIKTAEREMTFGELCCISENLDAKIRGITENTKSVIAVIAERSVEMYSAIYGIIRGGNAYLPIDPTYPSDRIEYILSNSNAAAVVCQGKFTQLAGNIPCIDMTEFIKNSEKSSKILPSSANENDTAYVIYTSGSTGNPKGAKISHKSAVNRILWMHDNYPLKANDVILQKTPYTFDVSVWELFWWGITGGCLAASKPDEHFLPEKILKEAQKNKVTHIHFVPSVFELFLNYLESHKEDISKFESVKYVFLSGEALSASLVQRFYRIYDFNKVSLHNLYGPTECAVDVTYYDCSPDDVDPVPIGKPIYNTQIHIVDKYMKLVPVGVQGELCIAGVNVGQGYLNNETLTNEKFVNNPFGDGKLYKTGDLAYWREDGEIIFCGRNDSQVKLNGQRIEIGEIEAVISGVDGVDSVAVVVKKSSAKDMLVAFFTGENSSEEAIRSVCVNKLPKYMVPSAFIHLVRLPLNKNGKLDRRLLDEYKFEAAKTADKEPPANETEQYICEVFSNVLGRNDIYRNTDFFDMGGTSLSMISLLSEKGFENITAAEFMRNSTPSMLSLVMKSKYKTNAEYLEPLYVSDKAEKALILLPFAGGGAEAYSNFVTALKKVRNDISVYFIRYLHSKEECENAAKEIAALCKKSEVMLYSHCVGSAVALQIIKELEAKEMSVRHYFAGASIPPAKVVKMNLWNIVSDGILKTILVKAGADISGLSDEKTSEMLMHFRKDTDFANVSFAESKVKIKTPVSVIVSKNDMFTKNYRQARRLWEKYADNVAEVCYIESNSHYFQSESSEALADIIKKTI